MLRHYYLRQAYSFERNQGYPPGYFRTRKLNRLYCVYNQLSRI
jgi:hypothetical protein